MNPLAIKIIAILAIAGGLVSTGWQLRGWKYAKDNEVAQKAVNITNVSNIKLVEKKDENLAIVDTARRDLAAVRLRLKSCQTNPTPASGTSDPRPFPAGGQELADEATASLRELALKADNIVEGCRLLNDWGR